MERVIFWNNKGGTGKTTLTFQIINEYAFQNPEILWEQVKAMENEIWVGTFREVVAYNKRTRKKSLECARKRL